MKRIRLTKPDQEEDFSGYSTTKETLQFHSMAPLKDEDLVAFHLRLANQAALCGFQCGDCRGSYKQRQIRDRLLQVVDVHLRSIILQRNEDPTVEDILAVYQEDQNFQKHPGWTEILSYLELVELETFAESHLRFRRVVNSYLEQGGRLLIKGRSFKRYKNTPEIYSEYGKRTTALELVKIDDYDLIEYFPNLIDLTLRDSRFDSDLNYTLPVPLTKFALISEAMVDFEFHEFLEKSKDTLEHLHIVCPVWYFEMPYIFTKLKSVTRAHRDVQDSKVNVFLAPVLEVYHMKIFNEEQGYLLNWPDLHGLAITSLTLCYWDKYQENEQFEMVTSLESLKHLRILGDTNPEFKERISALHLETVDVYFTDEADTQDLMLDMLDDDCLHLIVDFLCAENLASLCQVHSRFAKVIAGRPKIEFCLNEQCLKRFPVMENRTFYRSLGRIVNKLTISECEEDTFYKVVGHFRKLDTLSIMWVKFSDEERLSEFPTDVRRMELDSVSFQDSISKSTCRELFRTLNSTLVELSLASITCNTIIESLTQFKHLRVLCVWNTEINPELSQLLKQNLSHMERLEWWNIKDGLSRIRPVVRELQNVRYLWLYHEFSLPPCCSFPELEELYLPGPNVLEALEGIHVPKLKMFKMEIIEGMTNYGRTVKDIMPRIEIWDIACEGSVCQDSLVKEILLGPTELQTLILYKKHPISDSHILALVKGLPKLTKVETSDCETVDWDVLRELRAYLKNHNRQLQWNYMRL